MFSIGRDGKTAHVAVDFEILGDPLAQARARATLRCRLGELHDWTVVAEYDGGYVLGRCAVCGSEDLLDVTGTAV